MPALSLRAKFLLTIVLGAVLPLAVVGVWLTRSTNHAGENLLRSELDASLSTIVGAVRSRWVVREGDLLLLSRNEVARTALASPAGAALSAEDAAYLATLAEQMRTWIPSITYRDTGGRVRWGHDRTDTTVGGPRPALASAVGPTIDVVLPVTDDRGARIGDVDARVALATILPEDSLSIGIAGARLSIVDRATSMVLLETPATPVPADSAPAPGMLRVSVALDAPQLTVSIAAPTGPYVAPFERSARIGLAVLMLVALGATGMSALLAARTGAALRRVADAADAVTAGDLERAVAWKGDDEIGRLAAAFNTMTASLKRTLDELAERRALSAVGEFATALSHEVRNALTAVRIDLQHADRRLSVGDGKEKELVGRALANVRRLDGAVTGSLRAARGGAAKRERVELREVLCVAMQEAEPVFATGGATLEPLPDPGAVHITGNAAALEQLFLNLLLNAGEALPTGGRARVEVSANARRVSVAVIDDGPGIAPEMLDRLGKGLHTTKARGTGIGVSIARRIAAAHGGEISFESEPGKGTAVRVVLPRA